MKKTVHGHNYRFFERNCVLIILFQLYGSEAGLFESNQCLFYQFITCDTRTQSPTLFQKILPKFWNISE